MKEDLITLETAKLAKSIGFNVQTRDFFVNGKSQSDYIFLQYEDEDNFLWQPSQSLLQKWLRETYFGYITLNLNDEKWSFDIYDLSRYKEHNNCIFSSLDDYNSYEETLETGLLKLINIIISRGNSKFLSIQK